MRKISFSILLTSLIIFPSVRAIQAFPIDQLKVKKEYKPVVSNPNVSKQGHVSGQLIVTGSLAAIDGRLRGDKKKHISLRSGWTNALASLPTSDRYYNQADVCAGGEVVAYLSSTAMRYADDGTVIFTGLAQMRKGGCASSHYNAVREQYFQCIVAPRTKAQESIRFSHGDDTVQVNVGVENTGEPTRQHYQATACYRINR